MVERSLPDRVLACLENEQPVSAALLLAEAIEATQRRLDELEEVVPKPWRPPPPGASTFIPKGPTP